MPLSEGSGGVFRIVRVVRRPEALGRAAAGIERGQPPNVLSFAHMALMAPFLIANPPMALLFGAIAATSFVSAFNQPGLGLIFPDNISHPWEYADKVRRLTMEKMYGKDQGGRLYQDEFSHRVLEIDLRSRAP